MLSRLDHQSNTCAKGHLSEGDRQLTLRHVDASRGSDQDQTGEINGERGFASCDRGIVAHDPRMIVTINWSSPNWMVCVFCAEISYKNRCNFRSNREAIKKFFEQDLVFITIPLHLDSSAYLLRQDSS